jgi:hypothetical protein
MIMPVRGIQSDAQAFFFAAAPNIALGRPPEDRFLPKRLVKMLPRNIGEYLQQRKRKIPSFQPAQSYPEKRMNSRDENIFIISSAFRISVKIVLERSNGLRALVRHREAATLVRVRKAPTARIRSEIQVAQRVNCYRKAFCITS